MHDTEILDQDVETVRHSAAIRADNAQFRQMLRDLMPAKVELLSLRRKEDESWR